jgi:DNA polymerase I
VGAIAANMVFLIVDGTNLAHRAYHALKNSQDGIPVSSSGVSIASSSSVLRSLLTIVQHHHATHLAVVFDNAEQTFRHTLYSDYKAGRKEKDAALTADIQTLQDLLMLSGVGIVTPVGYEADDAIATLITLAKSQPTLIYSSDRDLWQLVSNTTSVLCPSKGLITPDQVKSILGVRPTQVTDYKALKGDSTDNIPGIRGMGAKMAIGVLEHYESIEDYYAASMSKITGRPYTLMKQGEAEARLSKQLAVLVNHVPLEDSVDQFAIQRLDFTEMLVALKELGLTNIANSYLAYFGQHLAK